MGGNALKAVNTIRLDREQFEKCTSEVMSFLNKEFPTAEVAAIPAYKSKSTFGDLDVMVSSEGIEEGGGGERLRSILKQKFHSRQENKNGNVLSFEYRNSNEEERGFQVDIINIPRHSFNFAYHYFAFNDLGNLMGRIAHKMGLKFGHDGLHLPLRDGDYNYATILITRNYRDATSFLGFDHDRYKKGFNDLTEIFDYVAHSKHFNKNIFLLDEENSNYKHRIRNVKRKTYVDFLEWCSKKEGLNSFEYPEDKSFWIPVILEAFPGAKERFDTVNHEKEQIKVMHERFKGENVTEWTGGYTHQALGVLMKNVRKHFGNDMNFVEWLKKNNDEKLKEKILEVRDTINFKGMIGVPGTDLSAPLTKTKEERLKERREKRES